MLTTPWAGVVSVVSDVAIAELDKKLFSRHIVSLIELVHRKVTRVVACIATKTCDLVNDRGMSGP